jgi:hypothetical protein
MLAGMNQTLPDLLPVLEGAYHWRGLHEIRSRAHYVKDMHNFSAHSVQDNVDLAVSDAASFAFVFALYSPSSVAYSIARHQLEEVFQFTGVASRKGDSNFSGFSFFCHILSFFFPGLLTVSLTPREERA